MAINDITEALAIDLSVSTDTQLYGLDSVSYDIAVTTNHSLSLPQMSNHTVENQPHPSVNR